jgi:hypothetical protein
VSKNRKLRLSHSKRGRYRKCNRLYNLYDIKRIRTKGRNIFFTVGTLFHEGVRRWHQGMDYDIEAALVNDLETPLEMLDIQTRQKLEVEMAKVVGMLEGYQVRYDDNKKYQRIVCEQEAEIPLKVNPKLLASPDEEDGFTHVTYFGYLDCLMKDHNGDWWIKETKTTADGSDDFLTQAQLNFQLAGYMFLAKSVVGKWPKGVIFDVVKKTQIRQRQNEAMSSFIKRCVEYYHDDSKDMYKRKDIIVDKRMLKMWLRETRFEAEDMLRSHRLGYFPMNNEQCKGKYGLCSHFPVCSTGKVSPQLFLQKKS